MKRYIKSASTYFASDYPELYRDTSQINEVVSNCLHPDWEPELLEFIHSKYFKNKIIPKVVSYLNDTTDSYGIEFQNKLIELLAEEIASNRKGLGSGRHHSKDVLNFKSIYNELSNIAKNYA